jgi:predicted RNA-binding Zn ribbon-like protein
MRHDHCIMISHCTLDMLLRADDLSSISNGASESEAQSKSDGDVLEANVARAEVELYGAKTALKRAEIAEAVAETDAREARMGHALSVDEVKRYEESGIWRKRSDAEKIARDEMKSTGRRLRNANRQLWRANVQLKCAQEDERKARKAKADAQWALVVWWTNTTTEQDWGDSPKVLGMTLELVTGHCKN